MKISRHDRLEQIYKLYPKKMGKSQGLRTAIAQCKTNEDLDNLELAISNYIAHIITERTEKQFILYFSTFMNQWRDWLEPDTGKTERLGHEADLSDLGFDDD